jgi:hypothetical protein
MESILKQHLDYTMHTDQSKRAHACDYCEAPGSGQAVQITRKEDGFLWVCHRCRGEGKQYYSGFFPDEGASASQVTALTSRTEKKIDTRPDVVTLPDDYTTTIPAKGLVGLYDLELDPDDIERNDIGWSPSHKRIIVPIYKHVHVVPRNPLGNTPVQVKKLVGVMGRKLWDDDTEKPKWWTVRQKDIKHPRFISIPETITDRGTVVLVENIFSAIKVSKVSGLFSLGLLTSYLPYELYSVLQKYKVIIWLDPDAYNKGCKYMATMGNRGITSHNILSPKKPKDTTCGEMVDILAEALDNLPEDNH